MRSRHMHICDGSVALLLAGESALRSPSAAVHLCSDHSVLEYLAGLLRTCSLTVCGRRGRSARSSHWTPQSCVASALCFYIARVGSVGRSRIISERSDR